jgi:HEAT repeat protein
MTGPATARAAAPLAAGLGPARYAASERVLVALSLVIAALLALSLLFALATLALRLRNALAARQSARRERAWTPLVLDVLAGDLPGAALAGRVAPGDRARFADFLVRFAQRLRGPERETLAALAGPYLADIGAQLRSSRPEIRARGILTLGALHGEDRFADLVAALDDPSPLVAMTAARALARRDHPQHLDAVLAHLHRFAAWDPTFLASLLAGAGPAAAPALRALLADAAAPVTGRVVAAEALRMLHDLAAADAAGAIVLAGADAELVAAALRLLGAVGSPDQAPAVRAACASADAVARIHALAALGTLGDATDVPRLDAALDDADPWIALHAARSLRALGGDAALEAAAATRPRAAVMARQVLAE